MASVLRLIHFRATSPAALLLRRFSGAASSCCYALGESGVMLFDRDKFMPIEKFMKVHPVFERAPMDRLISPTTFNYALPYFTSESAKEWIRSGYLQVYFSKILKLSVTGAFVDGNVGVIEGLNTIAFLKLDTKLSSENITERFPMTFAGFTNFLQTKLREIYANLSSMPDGLKALMMMAISGKLPNGKPVPDHLITYHPEFLPLGAIVNLYTEAFRLLRREIPANGQPALAYAIIMDLHAMLGMLYLNFALTDDMVKGWSQRQKKSGLLGAFSISAPSGGHCNLKLLTKLERTQLEVLTRKAYSIPAPSTTTKLAVSASVASTGNAQSAVPAPATSIGSAQYAVSALVSSTTGSPTTSTQLAATGSAPPVNPVEAKVLDTHRHCMVHLVEDHHVARLSILPPSNQASFRQKPMGWKDGVHLMLHSFPRYPHSVVVCFEMHNIWDMLELKSRFPIPQVFSSPPFRQVPAGGLMELQQESENPQMQGR